MDVNGTRFHLISGNEDWQSVSDASPDGGGAYWNHETSTTGLRPELTLFARGRRATPLDGSARRGAARDRFGTWYWIGRDRAKLYRAPAGSRRAVIYWQAQHEIVSPQKGEFAAKPAPIEIGLLSGLAITAHHYLVTGLVESGGLLIFDLHSGGEPLHLILHDSVPFEPHDLTATEDGGFWILDRLNRRLWRFDRDFRLVPMGELIPAPPESGTFHEESDEPESTLAPILPPPTGLPVDALLPSAIESLPDGSVLMLADPPLAGANAELYRYRAGTAAGVMVAPTEPASLPGLGSVLDGDDQRPVVAYDMAYVADEGRLYIVDLDGNQSFAYRLELLEAAGPGLLVEPLPQYLPMHYFGGRALVASTHEGQGALFYDVTPNPQEDLAVRWVRLHEIDQPRYTRVAWLETPVMDSNIRGCVWHRLFLDACIPPETEIEIWSRTDDDDQLLARQAYRRQPTPYLRSDSAEIPYWDGWTGADAAYAGTWEVLFQQDVGRVMQLRIVLTGNGRSSPQIARVRTYYPRFSYPKKYLPVVYQEATESADFLERFLANMEGLYTEIEGKIAGARIQFDPRSAPADTLDWLAVWLGMVLDPLWSDVGQEDRRRLMIRFARRLYERRGTIDGIRFALLLLLDPCLETTLARFEAATVTPDSGLRQELESLGLAYPDLAATQVELEELLYNYVLCAPGRDRVRIVERWQSRQGMALQAGDATEAGDAQEVDGDLEGIMENAAHRFSVLVPEDLPEEHMAMVEKIVHLEKPAHTDCDLRRFWDFFLVGQARLGIDTILGEESRFLPIILGRDYLSEGYLEAAHPMNVAERSVSDRDRLGDLRL